MEPAMLPDLPSFYASHPGTFFRDEAQDSSQHFATLQLWHSSWALSDVVRCLLPLQTPALRRQPRRPVARRPHAGLRALLQHAQGGSLWQRCQRPARQTSAEGADQGPLWQPANTV